MKQPHVVSTTASAATDKKTRAALQSVAAEGLTLNDLVEGDTPRERLRSRLQLLSARRAGLHALRARVEREQQQRQHARATAEDRLEHFLASVPPRKARAKQPLTDDAYIQALDTLRRYLTAHPDVRSVTDVPVTEGDIRALAYSVVRTNSEEVAELDLDTQAA